MTDRYVGGSGEERIKEGWEASGEREEERGSDSNKKISFRLRLALFICYVDRECDSGV